MVRSDDEIEMKQEIPIKYAINKFNDKSIDGKKFLTINFSSTAILSRNIFTQRMTSHGKVKSLENILINPMNTSIIEKHRSENKDDQKEIIKCEKNLFKLKIKNFTNINKFITSNEKSIDRNSETNCNDQTLSSSNRKTENKNKLMETIELVMNKKINSYTNYFKEKQKKSISYINKTNNLNYQEIIIKEHSQILDINCCFYFQNNTKFIKNELLKILNNHKIIYKYVNLIK